MKNKTIVMLLLSIITVSAAVAVPTKPSENNWSNCTYFSPYYGGIKMGEGIIGAGNYSKYSFVKFVKNFILFSKDVDVTNVDKNKREVSVQTHDGSILFVYKFNVDVTKSKSLTGRLFSLRDNEYSLIANAVCTGPLK